jgi:hypothetical protein
MTGFYYLTSPYTRYPGGIYAAHADCCREAGLLMRAGISFFSPIAQGHSIARWGDIDALNQRMWMAFDRPMMDAACGLIVLQLPGWEASDGVDEEIKIFSAAGKPIVYMMPGTVPALPSGDAP